MQGAYEQLRVKVALTDGCANLKRAEGLEGGRMVFFRWHSPVNGRTFHIYGFGSSLDEAAAEALEWEGFKQVQDK
ncbi:hypothetical protein HYX70_02125 [Candidatus Saccharibacteria bacterium]|nr:hypothetical protein [Candidatus Saccharibacteria bacterium]